MAPGDQRQTQTHPREGESLSSSRGCQVTAVPGAGALPSQLVFRYEEWSCLSGCEGETDQTDGCNDQPCPVFTEEGIN